MLCRELMKRELHVVRPDNTVQTAARLMRGGKLGFLPVCNPSGEVLGTLTDWDIVVRLVADDLPTKTQVAQVMTREVIACGPDEDVREAQARMRAAQKSRIMCTDAQGRLLGVISLSDIAQIETDTEAAETVRAVTTREAPPPVPPIAPGGPVDAKSERVFRRIEQSGVLPPGMRAPETAGAVLCVLSLRLRGDRDLLSLSEALPPTLREVVRPCVLHRSEPPDTFGRAELSRTLAEHLQTTPEHADLLAEAVFDAVQAEIPIDDAIAVEQQLPDDLTELWGRHRRAA